MPVISQVPVDQHINCGFLTDLVLCQLSLKRLNCSSCSQFLCSEQNNDCFAALLLLYWNKLTITDISHVGNIWSVQARQMRYLTSQKSACLCRLRLTPKQKPLLFPSFFSVQRSAAKNLNVFAFEFMTKTPRYQYQNYVKSVYSKKKKNSDADFKISLQSFWIFQ